MVAKAVVKEGRTIAGAMAMSYPLKHTQDSGRAVVKDRDGKLKEIYRYID